MKKHHAVLALLAVLITLAATNLLSSATQKIVSLAGGEGWDGVSYYNVAEQLRSGQIPHGDAAFVYRIGTPLLAALLPGEDLLGHFKAVNIFGNLVACAFLLYWLRLFVASPIARAIAVCLFITAWLGPIRFVFFYPALSDSWMIAFSIAGLIVIQKFRRGDRIASSTLLLTLISVIGVCFRESVIAIPLAALFCRNPIKHRSDSLISFELDLRGQGPLLVPLCASLGTLVGLHRWIGQDNHYAFLTTSATWAYFKPLVSYLLAWFISFGPVFVFVLYRWRTVIRFLSANQYVFAFQALVAVMAWIGGSDTERILFWSAPTFFLLLAVSLEASPKCQRAARVVIPLICFQALSQRLVWTIPDYPNNYPSHVPVLTVPGTRAPYLDLYSFHGAHWVEMVAFAEYLLVTVILLLLMRSAERGQRGPGGDLQVEGRAEGDAVAWTQLG